MGTWLIVAVIDWAYEKNVQIYNKNINSSTIEYSYLKKPNLKQ